LYYPILFGMFRAKSNEEKRIGPGDGQIFLGVTDSTGPQPVKRFTGLAKAALLFNRLDRLWVAVPLARNCLAK
jgi:hypothetical protein